MYIHAARMQSFSPRRQPSLFNRFLKGEKQQQQKPSVHAPQIDRVCSSLDMNHRDPTSQIRFRIIRSMKSTHVVAVSRQWISLPHCQNQSGKIRLQIDAREFSAAGCDHTGRFLFPCSPKLQLKLCRTLLSTRLIRRCLATICSP